MRGTGSLQKILGRSNFASNNKKRKIEQDSDPPPPQPAPPPRNDSPLKDGNLRCPVCFKQLPQKHGHEYMNDHIDKCLSKASTSTAKQQPTLHLFAQERTAPPPLPLSTNPPQAQQSPSPAALRTTRTNPMNADDKDQSSEDVSWGTASPSSQQQQPTPSTAAAATNSNIPVSSSATASSSSIAPLSFVTCIVGRQFQKRGSDPHLSPGERLSIEPEENNPRDRNALLVVLPTQKPIPRSPVKTLASNSKYSSPNSNPNTDSEKNSIIIINGTPLGHLPAVVAKHICPLLRKGLAVAEAVVNLNENELAELSQRAPLPIEVIISPAVILSETTATKAKVVSRNYAAVMIKQAVEAAKSAAEAMNNSSIQRGAAGMAAVATSGEKLRKIFATLYKTVLEYDAHVLDELELGFLSGYESVSPAAQSLLLRLTQRNGPVFRVSCFAYSEVPEPVSAAMELANAGIMHCLHSNNAASNGNNNNFTWEEIAGVLTVPELQTVLGKFIYNLSSANNQKSRKTTGGPSMPSTRAAVLSALNNLATNSNSTAVVQELCTASGVIVRIAEPALIALERLQRLFFLNEGHSLSQFLATDTGAIRYPPYTITRRTAAFPTRDHYLHYEQALQEAALLMTALEEGDLTAAEAAAEPAWAAIDAGRHKKLENSSVSAKIEEESQVIDLSAIDDEEKEEEIIPEVPLFMRRYSAPWIYCTMATVAISLLERQKKYREAVDRLQQLLGGHCCPTRRGHWWIRLSTDLEHLNRPNDALEIAETALADEWLGPGDRLALQRRILRLGKPPRRWKIPPWAASAQREPKEVRIEAQPLPNNTGLKSIFIGKDGQQCSVEELGLQYYASEIGGEYQGAHTEGGIWATLFGILLWPVLFNSTTIPDVFRTPFQTAPLDLDSDGFYASRAVEIETQLENIAAGAAGGILASIWEQNYGTFCRGVNWERWNLEKLQEITECVGGRGLAAVMRLLAQDHAGWQGGMPDLLLWCHGKREAKLAEVKGPRDRLSDHQRAWIMALEDAGIKVEVLKVMEPSNGKNGGGGKRNKK